ncbi:MAG TPA: hypothetical protein VJS92_07555 [Candidatus Polarisedimenticolaceae bacterium]|nr:hypothetical protein [Candidatus Polarisedimenticolaceae bacterium]
MTRARRLGLISASLLLAGAVHAGPIQDNSFLLEEAYNQEAGVVQHITNVSFDDASDSWLGSFTQEWPAPTQRHQLGFTVTWQQQTLGGSAPGDLALNYRYQLLGSGESTVALAPRLSLVLPAGGAGGVQGNLPLSVVLHERWVTHVNVGASFLRRAESDSGDRADLTAFNFGQSVVWLVRPRFNALVELVFTTAEEVVGPSATERVERLLVSPGVRWSHDLSSGLQIVPGIAVPLGLGPSSGERVVLFYLSFEHPFRAR